MKTLVVLGLGFSCQYAKASSEQKSENSAVMELEHEAGIAGTRRYIRIPVVSGYQESRTSLKKFLTNDKEGSTKSFHGKSYQITEVIGTVPEKLLNDEASEFVGALINRSTNAVLDSVVYAVYEFGGKAVYQDGSVERFIVEYTEINGNGDK